MLSPNSKEAKISQSLDDLGCAGNNFADIAGVVSKSRLATGLAGNDFEPEDADRMLEVLGEMRELRDLSQSPPDWKRTDEIRKALEERRAAKKLIQDVKRVLTEWNELMMKEHPNV